MARTRMRLIMIEDPWAQAGGSAMLFSKDWDGFGRGWRLGLSDVAVCRRCSM